jgi:pimeloyl-ACP methyl ester carboxylesterase
VLVGFSMGGGEWRYVISPRRQNVSKAVLVASVVPFMLKTGQPHGTPKETFDEMTAGMKADRMDFFAGFFKDFYGVSLLSHPVSELIASSCNVSMTAVEATLACAAGACTDFLASFQSADADHSWHRRQDRAHRRSRPRGKGIANST